MLSVGYLSMNSWLRSLMKHPPPPKQSRLLTLLTRTRKEGHIAEETTHLGHRSSKNQAGIKLEDFSILASFQRARRLLREKSHQKSDSAVNSASYNKTCQARCALCCKSGINGAGVTTYFLIGVEVHCIGGNSCLVLYKKRGMGSVQLLRVISHIY